MTQTPVTQPSPEASSIAQSAFQQWSAGSQAQAIDSVRPFADRGEPWAVGLIVWLLMQQGVAGFEPAIPYAKRAQAIGMPWVAFNLFNSMIGQISSAPNLLESCIDLIATGPLFAPGIDPIGQGWNLLAQNLANEAVRLMNTTSSFPVLPAELDAILSSARKQTVLLQDLVRTAQGQGQQVNSAAVESTGVITNARDELLTAAKQAGLLISTVTSDATNSLFKADAKRNESQSRVAWAWGLGILIGAAAIAVLPLIIHYIGNGPDYSPYALFAVHATSTLALGTVAGVILARARGRDRASQRANDLSTAMGTMISYSNQIQNDDEKQRFMLTMGQLVLQAHLTGDSAGGSKEESLAGFAALISLLRQPPPPAAP